MTKLDILKHIADNHNRLMRITVSGDNAILMGETLVDMRLLAQEMQKDVEIDETDTKDVDKALIE